MLSLPADASREATPRRRPQSNEKLETLGTLPQRTPVGHRARGLLGQGGAGARSPTTTPAAAPTAGARTACTAGPTAKCRLCFAPALGTARIRSSRSASSASAETKATTARTSRSATTTSIPPPPTPTPRRSTNTRRRVPLHRTQRRRTSSRGRTGPNSSSPTLGLFNDGRYFDVVQEVAKRRPKTSSGASPSPTTARTPPPSTSCPRSGSATSGAGDTTARRPVVKPEHPARRQPGSSPATRRSATSSSTSTRRTRHSRRWLFTENETNYERRLRHREPAPPTSRTPSTATHRRREGRRLPAADGHQGRRPSSTSSPAGRIRHHPLPAPARRETNGLEGFDRLRRNLRRTHRGVRCLLRRHHPHEHRPPRSA